MSVIARSVPTKNRMETIEYKLPNGDLHRPGDLPAVIYKDGSREWWKMGKRHRGKGKPAVEQKSGHKEWWENGKQHRGEGKPAVVDCDGTCEYWENGLCNRDGGLPAVVYLDGDVQHWQDGKLHNISGPAIYNEKDTEKIRRSRGQYWIEGVRYTREEYDKFIQGIKRKNRVKSARKVVS